MNLETSHGLSKTEKRLPDMFLQFPEDGSWSTLLDSAPLDRVLAAAQIGIAAKDLQRNRAFYEISRPRVNSIGC